MTWSKVNVPFKTGRLLSLMFLLVAVSVANASPTVTREKVILPTKLRPCPVDSSAAVSCTIANVVGPTNPKLADLGKEFLQPPLSSAGSSGALGNPAKSLPAIPAAILMALVGFLCVSLVRDRRVWLAGLAGLFWLSHAGIHAVPQLAHRFCRQVHTNQRFVGGLGQSYLLKNTVRPRCDIEGTQYIGLLHHLAGIPQDKSDLTITQRGGANTPTSRRKLFTKVLDCPATNTSPRPSAIISEQYSLNSLLECLVSRTEQFIVFSPAFIFDNLARGPPIPA